MWLSSAASGRASAICRKSSAVIIKSFGTILFGTDVGYLTDFDTREEFTKMAEAGMTFQDILASLTTTPARWRGFAASSGQIAVGFDADLTAITGDPAAAVAAFARVSCTIRRGRVIYAAGRR